MKKITAQAGYTQTWVEERGPAIERNCDTLKEACALAQKYLTDHFTTSAETDGPFLYARVMVDDKCYTDYYRKDGFLYARA